MLEFRGAADAPSVLVEGAGVLGAQVLELGGAHHQGGARVVRPAPLGGYGGGGAFYGLIYGICIYIEQMVDLIAQHVYYQID